ncbi:sulfotransferase family protein [Oleiagrimonas citrea]|nr:sulfotransferase [Oleiagrimonas citrea]
MTASSPVRKIFVVGCPRSGTTVIQALLAERPDVLSFGETNYMLRLLGHFDRWLQDDRSAAKKWRRRLRLARGKTHGDMRRCLDNAFKAYDDVPGLRRKLSGRGYIREFCRILDAMALERGCSCWVEKTPDHLAYLDVLEKEVPEAHFLHVLRKGEDVMASVLDGQLRYSRHNVFAGSLPYWVRRWNRASQEHVRFAGRPRHTVLPYECLFTSTQRVREFLQALPGPPEQKSSDPRTGLKPIADLDDEPWKDGSTDGVLRPPERKFENMFGPGGRAHLARDLHDYEDIIASIAERQPDLPWIADAAAGMPAAAS